MKKIERFEDLEVWKESVEIAKLIYIISENDKIKSDYGMKDQIRRSATSISNNIAEGFEYNSTKNFIKYLKIAKGSAGELRSQLYILFQTGYISEEIYKEIFEQCINISKQLSGFIKYLQSFEHNKTKS